MRRKILAGCRLMNPDLQHDPTAGCGPVPARERPKQGWVILAPADAADLPRAFEALEASGLRPIPWEPTPDASPQTDPGAAQVPVAELIALQMWIVRPADALRFLGAASTDGQGSSGESTTPSLWRLEWNHIQRVLADCGGNISAAARRLGMHRRSLQRKLAKHPPVR